MFRQIFAGRTGTQRSDVSFRTTMIGVAALALALFEGRGGRFHLLPSAAALGFGLILPGLLTIPIAIGGVLAWIWQRRSPDSFAKYRFTVSGVLVPVLAALGLLPAPSS
jgi:uncharacterized oligopeptide transporter (OPT) family protein